MDNSLYIGSSIKIFEDFKQAMMQKIEMMVMSLLYFFLGIEVSQNEYDIFISHDCLPSFLCSLIVDRRFMPPCLHTQAHNTQNKYAQDLLKRFRMPDVKPISTSMEVSLKLNKNDRKKIVIKLFIEVLLVILCI